MKRKFKVGDYVKFIGANKNYTKTEREIINKVDEVGSIFKISKIPYKMNYPVLSESWAKKLNWYYWEDSDSVFTDDELKLSSKEEYELQKTVDKL